MNILSPHGGNNGPFDAGMLLKSRRVSVSAGKIMILTDRARKVHPFVGFPGASLSFSTTAEAGKGANMGWAATVT